jgi:hypothetical protein
METSTPSLQSLAGRVKRLEKQNRWLRRAGLAVLFLAAAVGVMGQARPSRVVEANEFVLKDSAGRVRARLSMEGTNRPTLSFYDENSHIPASLAGGDEPFLVLNRAGSNEQVSLGANKTLYGLALYDKTIRVGLSVQKGVPGLDLFDESGKRRAAITAPPTGPTFNLTDSDGKAGFTLWVAPFGAGPDLSMYDSAGKLRVDLVAPPGGPSLKLSDQDGFSTILGSTDLLIPRTGRKESTSAASLVLFGKDGKVLWSAP